MDTYTLSQIIGGSTILLKWTNSLFPDARRMRFTSIVSNYLSGTAFALLGEKTGASCFFLAGTRSALRATKWGKGNRRLLTEGTIFLQSAFTAGVHETPLDLAPILSSTLGSIGDDQDQGRYRRALFFINNTCVNLPFSIATRNYATAANIGITCLFLGKAIYQHDIKNAAHPEARFSKNLRSYLYGIFRNAATGAHPGGQTPVHSVKDLKNINRTYSNSLKQYNPQFENQTALLAECTFHPERFKKQQEGATPVF